MSLRAMVWVLEHSDARLGDRLVLLALADHADDDGRDAYPSQETIARKARITDRQVRRCLLNLERDGLIERDGKSKYGTVVWHLKLTPDNMSTWTSTTETLSEMSDEPSFEPSSECVEAPVLTLTAKEPRGVPRARENGWKVDRSPVTLDETNAAARILDEWNEQTGQQLRSRDWLAKIVMRIREHPDLTVTEHAHVIAHALAHPWWDGPPSPSVVYGSGAQFERALTAARAPALSNGNGKRRYGYGVTSSELGEWAAQLRSQGR